MEGRYQFSSPEWDDRSDTVKDLVSSFLWLMSVNKRIFAFKL